MSNHSTYGYINKCQICSSKNLETILVLGHQPIVQNYLTANQLHEPEITYPLNLCRCVRCGLVQLDYIVDPRLVFPLHYPYRTGLTNMLIKNFRSLADVLEKKYSPVKGELIIDIGSNDGTLLQGFKEKGMRVLGVEPTDAAKTANKNGITTIQDFFDRQVAEKIVKKYGRVKIVTATNVFAHIPNAPELLENIKSVLAEDGVFVSESQYLMDIVEKLEFDTVYHEHLRFYSLKPLRYLFSFNGCTLVDAERIPAAGGSIRVYAMKGKRPASSRLRKLMAEEKRAGIYGSKKMLIFAQKIISAKNDLMSLLLQCKKNGGRIAGLSSPARSNTLLGFAQINHHLLDYACEKKGSPKIGLYTPGTHLPVVDESKLLKEQPDYVLVLSWHISLELMQKIRQAGYQGQFIVPLPQPKVVDSI